MLHLSRYKHFESKSEDVDKLRRFNRGIYLTYVSLKRDRLYKHIDKKEFHDELYSILDRKESIDYDRNDIYRIADEKVIWKSRGGKVLGEVFYENGMESYWISVDYYHGHDIKLESIERTIEDRIKYVRGISDELKQISLTLLKKYTKASKGKITGLVLHPDLIKKIRDKGLSDGFDMGIDGDGYFIHTHRARSKSHSKPDGITIKEIKFINSTG